MMAGWLFDVSMISQKKPFGTWSNEKIDLNDCSSHLFLPARYIQFNVLVAFVQGKSDAVMHLSSDLIIKSYVQFISVGRILPRNAVDSKSLKKSCKSCRWLSHHKPVWLHLNLSCQASNPIPSYNISTPSSQDEMLKRPSQNAALCMKMKTKEIRRWFCSNPRSHFRTFWVFRAVSNHRPFKHLVGVTESRSPP